MVWVLEKIFLERFKIKDRRRRFDDYQFEINLKCLEIQERSR